MGRKRKAVAKCSAIADEVKTPKSYLGATSPDEKSCLHRAVEGTNIEKNVQLNSNSLPAKKKTSSVTNVVMRRSGRLRSPVYPARSHRVKPVVEHVNLDENEKEESPKYEKVNNNLPVVNEKNLEVETQVQVQVQQDSPQPDVDERSLEEKVNYLVRAVDEFKPKVIGISNEDPPPDFSYRSLYFQSQKKNEALMKENYELVRNLEFARGQIAAYEKIKDFMGALKEVIFVSGLGKSIEANVSLSPQTVNNCMPFPSAAVAVPDAAADDPKQKKSNYKKKKARNG